MHQHGATEWFEIERKYEVLDDADLPVDFSRAGLVAEPPKEFQLVASYYDTPLRELAQERLALRHRIGGPDAGWHLKERGADGTKELTWPGSSDMPQGAIGLLKERIGESVQRLSPTATLRVDRTLIELKDSTNRVVIELVDDRVHSFDHIEEVERSWREWEAELRPDAQAETLERLEPILRDAGALPSLSDSKIARTLGKILSFAEDHGAGPRQLASLAITDVADRLAVKEQSATADVALLRRLARSVLD